MARGEIVSDEVKNHIVKLHHEGTSRSVIKERLGVSDWIITQALRDTGSSIYKGTFNWSGEILTLYTTTTSLSRAKKNFIHQLVRHCGYNGGYLRNYFNPEANNWGIERVAKIDNQ